MIQGAGAAGEIVGAARMVPKLNPPSLELVDDDAARGLIRIARGNAVLDASRWVLYEADLTPQVLREIAEVLEEREREERDFKLVAALRNEPEGVTLDEMRKKYGL
jgi:hypothetical protein